MNDDIVDELTEIFGANRVVAGDEIAERFLEDWWVVSIHRHRRGAAKRPRAVVRPGTTKGVARLFRWATERGVPVVPSGARSGVCGGAMAPEDAVLLDLSDFDEIRSLEETGLRVAVGAAVRGGVLEAWLGERGYTLGHFPQSIDLSSVGGWVATRASGQLSTRYGNIEDMVLAFEAVLPDGTIVRTRPVPRRASGPDVRSFLVGGEGAFGVVTEVELAVHPRPESQMRASWSFPRFAAGLDTLRAIVRPGWRPAVLRLYDEIETGRNFPGVAPEGNALLLVHAEGPAGLPEAEIAAAGRIAETHGGEAHGAEPVARWFETRNHVPHLGDFLEKGLVVDTIEVATGWERIHDLYGDVLQAVREVPGVLVASGHSSHSYGSGTNVYFTFAAQPAEDEVEKTYFAVWDAAMKATLRAGGTISHHHGIGRLRTKWMEEEHGSSYELLRRWKKAVDPAGVANPGVLVPR